MINMCVTWHHFFLQIMINFKFITEVETDKWKSVIGFSQSNNASLSQNLRVLQDYEVIEVCFNEFVLSGLRYFTLKTFHLRFLTILFDYIEMFLNAPSPFKLEV